MMSVDRHKRHTDLTLDPFHTAAMRSINPDDDKTRKPPSSAESPQQDLILSFCSVESKAQGVCYSPDATHLLTVSDISAASEMIR